MGAGFHIDDSTVLIRWIEVASVADDAWPVLYGLLDSEEQGRADRFYFEEDRRSFVAAHSLTRCVLSTLAGGSPQDWRFTVSEKGKPEAVMAGSAPRIRVNLSHTRGMALVAATVERDLGIDVEASARSTLTLDIADRFFAPSEVAALHRMPPAELRDGLFAFWTLKEAFIKAIGLGLSMPLEAFAFDLSDLSISFVPGHEKPGPWLFRRFEPVSGFPMALALRHPWPESVAIDVAGAAAADMIAGWPV